MKFKAIKKKPKTKAFKDQRLADKQLKHVKGGNGGNPDPVPADPEELIGSTDTFDG